MKTIRLTLLSIVILLSGYLIVSTQNKSNGFSEKKKTLSQVWDARMQHKRLKSAAGIGKADNPNEYAKFHQLIRTKDGADFPAYKIGYKTDELNRAKSLFAKENINQRREGLTFTERGPGNVPGRTRALLILPNDASGNTWLAGSASGGIWKTTDAGQSWVNKTEDLANLATSTLAMSASNASIIYAGTGEPIGGGSVEGDGIFKSTNGGESWTQLSSTKNNENFRNIYRIIVDPANPNIVLAATRGTLSLDFMSSIFRSTNGGASWTKVYTSSRSVQQIIASPNSFNIQYATLNGFGAIKSTDAGLTWQNSNSGMIPSGRIEMAISPVDNSRLYASAEGSVSGNGLDLYISDDAGATWFVAVEENNGTNIDFFGGQGWYDNAIVAHPFNKDIVYFGGVNLGKATMKAGEETGSKTVTSVEEINTSSFLALTSFGADYFGGTIDNGNIPNNDHVSVEVRFGSGVKQKAHRFTVGNEGSGVPATGYTYRDYVEIPFEVWDIDNNKQLMVSFRDQKEDGVFDLIHSNTDGDASSHSREYVYIHNVEYSDTPDSNIAQNGGTSTGHEYKSMYFFWPILTQGAVWSPNALPTSTLRINFEEITKRLRETEVVADAYSAFGGINSFTQTIGATTTEGLHPDHHGLFVIPVNVGEKTFRIIDISDGGIYYSGTSANPGVTDGDWTFAGNGYNTNQFYGADKKPGADEYVGGMQDNGSWRTPKGEVSSASTDFVRQRGGDGFEALWHNADANKIIVSSQYNSFGRTKDGGRTWLSGTVGLTDTGSGKAPFVSKISNSKSNPDRVFAMGQQGVWKSNDFAENWTLTRLMSDFTLASNTQVKVSIANPEVVWAGTGMTDADKLHVSTDGGSSFKSVNNFTETTLGGITDLATHPIDDQIAYAIFSIADAPKILRTSDLGETWSDITGFIGGGGVSTNGFPDVAVYSLLVFPHEPNTIWAGTEIGIVESKNNGVTWSLLGDNLPNVSVWDMKVQDDQIVLATHGRGIWTVTIPELPEPIITPNINNMGIAFNQDILINADLRSDYDSTEVHIDGQKVGTLGVFPIGNINIKVFGFSQTDGVVELKLISYVDGNQYISTEKELLLFKVDETKTSYGSDFNDVNTDFVGDGFKVIRSSGFSNGAINSLHPYAEKTQYIYQLKTPIIVAASGATILYDDVAIIETGDAGKKFGEAEFWDYVVVEGSKDGIVWQTMADGYDANSHGKWKTAYDQSKNGTQSMFKEENINILDTFNPKDTIFVRFRLFSDDLTVGWGWAIDNLYIQEERPSVLGIADDILNALSIEVYPNPIVDNKLSVNYYLPQADIVTFKIISAEGKIAKVIHSAARIQGKEKKIIDLKGLGKGIYFLRMETSTDLKTRKIVIE